ncbi:MucBP domain-containing protein [Lactococcus nasutitermitis]|uniref:MucBP domain-containing protein n=1 Tax=Lactococcus nasutitermitis TaxID=1652957 RepID=A0ABV9JDH7_9LACT|nr:MucBP domain-containing protein [Lactococcus nasutitermitis]
MRVKRINKRRTIKKFFPRLFTTLSVMVLTVGSTTSGINNALPDNLKVITAHAAATPTITVTPRNFLNYFQLAGTATYFSDMFLHTDGTVTNTNLGASDTSVGLLTLTTALNNQAGIATMKNQFDMSGDWVINGYLNIGHLNGADGVGFGWTTALPGKVGDKGGELGIGSLPGTFGWGADTYWNPDAIVGKVTSTNPNTWSIGDTNPVPSGNGGPYGNAGWMFSSPTHSYYKTMYNGTDSPQKDIQALEDDKFHPITFGYTASTGLVNVNYAGLLWSIPITTLEQMAGVSSASTVLSFFISASTGGYFNNQQFALTSMSFVPAQGTLNVNYVDTDGNTIAPSTTQSGNAGSNYSTNPLNPIPTGYVLDHVTSTDSSASINADETTTGNFLVNGTTVTYVYKKIIPATVTYIDDVTGKTLSVDDFTNISNSNYSTSNSISAYEGQGYQVVSDGTVGVSNLFADTTGANNNYVVHLTHTYSTVNLHTTKETIHYLADSDKTTVLAPNYNASISFVSVKDNVTQTTIGSYYIPSNVTDSNDIALDNTGKVTTEGWLPVQAGETATFDAVTNPEVEHMKVVSTDDPNQATPPDLTRVMAQTIQRSNQADLSINVYYAPLTHIVEQSKTITRNITYVDANDHNIVLGTAETQKVTFTAHAVEDDKGTVLGYDTDGDGAVDVPANEDGTVPGAAWGADTNSQGNFSAVFSPDYSAKGYGAPSQESVPELAADKTLADGTDIEVVVSYPYNGQNIKLPFTGGSGLIGLVAGVSVALGLSIGTYRRQRKKH